MVRLSTFSQETVRRTALSVLGWSRADHLARWMTTFDDRAVVLAYHSIADSSDYASPAIQVSCEDFERQISHLNQNYNLVKLSEIAAALDGDWNLPERSVAITLDDGYADNISNALPILEKYNAPASLFVTVKPVLERAPFWVGRLERAIRTADGYEALSKRLLLPCSLNTGNEAFSAAASHINNRSGNERRKAISNVEEALKNDGARIESFDDFMASPEQLKSWQAAGMEIGAHSLTHPILTSLDDDEAFSELKDSKTRLETELGTEIPGLAYPNGPGVASNVDKRIVNLARKAGFKYAVTSKRGAVFETSSALAIPRIAVNERLRGAAFRWKLERGFTQQAPNLPDYVSPNPQRAI